MYEIEPGELETAEASSTFARARDAARRLLGKIRPQHAETSSSSHPLALTEGELVAGRYRIQRFLGRGGAGQVYEAEDLELGEHIALKTLHPHVATSPEALAHLKREVLLARTVTHENVCRLFDLGRHTPPRGPDLLFLTMELIQGETLAERARREVPMDPDAALPLIIEVGHGLAAAHRQGVVHRDVKASNVLLALRPNGTTRAVVTDFGLALARAAGAPRTSKDPEGSSATSREGPRDAPVAMLQGTPLYMAPEQVVGEEISPATDVYGLGVLLYHLLTGAWPFEGQHALATALARLDHAPIPPRQHRPDLAPDLERLLLRCLERDPDRRPASAEDLLALLAETCSPEIVPAPRPRSRFRSPGLLPIALGIPVTLAAFLAWGSLNRPRPPASPAETAMHLPSTAIARPALLVLPIENATGKPELDWIATALTDALGSSLAAGDALRLIEGDAAFRVQQDLVASANGNSVLGAPGLARRSGAEWALHGKIELPRSTAPGSPDLRWTANLQRLNSPSPAPEPPASEPVFLDGQLDALADLATRGAARLRRRLEIPQPPSILLENAAAELPRDSQAARLYAQGLEALRDFDLRRASEELRDARELAGDHPLILMRLAETWERLGYTARARTAAERAVANHGALGRPRQLEVEARARVLAHEWQRAEEIYAVLRELFPDDLEIGLALVAVQDRAGRYEAAFASLESLRRLPSPSGQDPRLDLAEAMAAYHQGDSKRSQAAARRAAARGRQLGSPSLVGAALVREALSRVHTDPNLDAIEELLAEAMALQESVRNPADRASALYAFADLAERRGDLDSAERHVRAAIRIGEKTGSSPTLARGRTALAILHDRRGRLAEGLAVKEEALADYRRREVRAGIAVTLENLGISLLKMGRPKEARERFAEARQHFAEIGDRIGLAWVPYWEARIWLDLGELDLARPRVLEAQRAAQDHPDGGLAPYAAFEMARLELAAGQLKRAEEIAEDLLAKVLAAGQDHDAAEVHLLLAQIARATGEAEYGIELAEKAQQYFAESHVIHLDAAARVELVNGHLAKTPPDIPRRAAACAALAAMLDGLEHRAIGLSGQIAEARCRLTGLLAPPPSETAGTTARQALEQVVAEAGELELFEPLLEARRQLALLQHDGVQARRDIEALRRAAEARGWLAAAERLTRDLATLPPVAEVPPGSLPPSPDAM